MDGFIDLLQWPAMGVTIAAAWFVASSDEHRRNIGFWVFLASNVLWVVWAWSTQAWALVVLQLALAAMNIRGARKTDTTEGAETESEAGKAGASK